MPAAGPSNANVYQRLGLRTIVNASGPSTRLSGGIMRPEVAAAMAEASQWCVDLAELQGRASEILAEATGAEAGYVTAGASAALMLASAACLAGLDPAKMNRLPDTTGMANEVIVARSQRNMYDRAVAQAGAKLVEVGIPDRFSGAGVRDAQAWEYEAAITDRTAAILWVAQPHSEPGLPEIVAVARRHGLPVIVDAAGQLPPAENLRRFVAEGADLVAFSGGKAIGGPQASGILAGRRAADPVGGPAAARSRHLFRAVEPAGEPVRQAEAGRPAGERHRARGEVRQGGDRRPADGAQALPRGERRGAARALARDLRGDRRRPAGPQRHDGHPRRQEYKGAPAVELALDEDALGLSARELIKRLQDGEPSVHANHARVRDGIVVFGPTCMKPGDAQIVIERVIAELGAGSAGG